MNNLSRFLRNMLLLLMALIISGALLVRPAAADTSINIFYTQLAPYGTWFNHRTYGRVWQPHGVSRNWRPYTEGRWIYTDDYGWYWEADQEWGWAPFHYGRWAFDSFRGWVWIPGSVWAPAWVSWQYGQGYSAWAPLPPEIYWQPQSGLSFSYSTITSIPMDHWVVMSDRHFGHGHVRQNILPVYQNNIYVNNIHNHVTYVTVNNNRIFNPGVPKTHLEKEFGSHIKPVPVRQLDNIPQSGVGKSTNEIQIVRPHIESKIHADENHERDLAAKIVEENKRQHSPDGMVPATSPALVGQPKATVNQLQPDTSIVSVPKEPNSIQREIRDPKLTGMNTVPANSPALVDQPKAEVNELKPDTFIPPPDPNEQAIALPIVKQVDAQSPEKKLMPKNIQPMQEGQTQLIEQQQAQQQMEQQRQLEQQQQAAMQQRQAELQQQRQAQQQMEQQRQLEQQQQAVMQQQEQQRQAELQQQQQAQQRQLEQQQQAVMHRQQKELEAQQQMGSKPTQ